MKLWREAVEAIRIALESVLANKLRAGLTTLGIVIGILTVTLMGAAIEGLNRAFRTSISALGSDVFYVQRRAWFTPGYEQHLKAMRRKEITLAQCDQVRKLATLAKAVAPVIGNQAAVRHKEQTSSGVFIIGSTDDFIATAGNTVAEGRFFSSAESDGARPVCVLGWGVATNLFLGGESPIGKHVTLSQQRFEVVGVLGKQGNFLGQFSLDNQAIIPIHQFISLYGDFGDYEIHVKAQSVDAMKETRDELRGILRRIRKNPPGSEDDFAINEQEMFLETFNKVAGTIASAGLFITGLSLFVGGIGVMNIMFVSVAERTREIGIRKAIGAKRRAILIQFLVEAAGISLFGGLLGLALAFPVTLVINQFLPTTMSLSIIGLALLVSIVTGILSGFFPAWRAARMNPVDALRNE
jgi:putative ABC transport system permease protein